MWKHEIIEYVSNAEYMRKYVHLPTPKKTFENANAAPCFFMGDYEKIKDVPLDYTSRMPYNDFIVEYTIASGRNVNFIDKSGNIIGDDMLYTRMCYYVISEARGTWIFQFLYLKTLKTWNMNPLSSCYFDYANGRLCFAWDLTVPASEKSALRGEYHTDVAMNFTDDVHILPALLSCKNITALPVDPPEKLNKKRIKNGKTPLYRYHVLTVDVNKGRKLADKSPIQNVGIMPVHLCRGHFKEYSEEKPLFGKITGRFWWQPFARGNVKKGIVDKDYSIKS